jgi:tRNA threonylcarbamoyladenosine biosynthesis protein TsaB
MILGIETATAQGEVALLEGDALVGERALEGGAQRHAASLLLAIDALLEGTSLDAVEGIALSIGPGAFTSLRIGLATALGLCFGTDRWIVPVPTLAALASQAPGDAPVVPMLDARKGQIYSAVYWADGSCATPDCVASPLTWLESLDAATYTLLGPGVVACRDEVERVLGARARIVEARPRAASVARLGARLVAEGGRRAPADVELRYVRAPDLGAP